MSNESKQEFICPFLGNFSQKAPHNGIKIARGYGEMVGVGVLNCFKERCKLWIQPPNGNGLCTFESYAYAFDNICGLLINIENTLRDIQISMKGRKHGDG